MPQLDGVEEIEILRSQKLDMHIRTGVDSETLTGELFDIANVLFEKKYLSWSLLVRRVEEAERR
jgi:hypothetical protein